MKFVEWIKGLLSDSNDGDAVSEEKITALKETFKGRHKHFQRLITANTKELEAIADIEEALDGTHPIGMEFVRSRCTRAATNAFQMIRHMDGIAPGKYQALFERFSSIQGGLKTFLDATQPTSKRPLVLPLDAVRLDMEDEVGAKMATLGDLTLKLKAYDGFRAPRGFVITARGFKDFMEQSGIQEEINRLKQVAEDKKGGYDFELCKKIRRFIIESRLPETLATAIRYGYHGLVSEEGRQVTVAVRSSAIGEDSDQMSFAGQYQSIIGVDEARLLDAYKEVVASKYTPQAMNYRLHYGIRDEDVVMCVGCMTMVDALSGGVAYSKDPVSTEGRFAVVNSVFGLGKPVVSGTTEIDTFIVTRETPHAIVSRHTREKQTRQIYSEEAGTLMNVQTERPGEPSLTDPQILELIRAAMELEDHYGWPQDIEWALDKNDEFVILQSRPLRESDEEVSKPTHLAETMGEPDRIFEGGVAASRGVASGEVFVVRSEADAKLFPEGGVLVVAQPRPFWATLLGNACAVVSEQGGVACHLANVAREYKVPALFAVPQATKMLPEHNHITVDASGRCIYKGLTEIERTETKERHRQRKQGRVYKSLFGAARLITPLTLLNPDAPSFQAESCRTLHDIARFCHEKSVKEMFKFGIEQKLLERAGRKLFTDVATQFMVIDLDDGLIDGANDPYFVRLEEIISIPMLALWQGMTTHHWQGPPPVDTKGFLQVLAGAAMDPNLVPASHSDYTNNSYFMISRDFCNLQTRVGFHFGSVETLVGERTRENYISFHFTGGGANLERKIRRVRLIADTLEQRNFRTRVRGDNLLATLEGYEKPIMETALKVVGYLIVHTRQLDMALTDNQTLEQYRDRIEKDIESF